MEERVESKKAQPSRRKSRQAWGDSENKEKSEEKEGLVAIVWSRYMNRSVPAGR